MAVSLRQAMLLVVCLQVRKDHLMLALEKSESDRMEQEVRLAPAAALVSWRLDQSVRDTTARRQLDAIRRLAQPVTDSPFEALLRMVSLLGLGLVALWAPQHSMHSNTAPLSQHSSLLRVCPEMQSARCSQDPTACHWNAGASVERNDVDSTVIC
jgi:hypothetical protein